MFIKRNEMRNILDTVIAINTVERIVKLWYNSIGNEVITIAEKLCKYSEKKVGTE